MNQCLLRDMQVSITSHTFRPGALRSCSSCVALHNLIHVSHKVPLRHLFYQLASVQQPHLMAQCHLNHVQSPPNKPSSLFWAPPLCLQFLSMILLEYLFIVVNLISENELYLTSVATVHNFPQMHPHSYPRDRGKYAWMTLMGRRWDTLTHTKAVPSSKIVRKNKEDQYFRKTNNPNSSKKTKLTRCLEFLKCVIHKREMNYYGCSRVLCIFKHVTFLWVLCFFFTYLHFGEWDFLYLAIFVCHL